MTRIPDESGSGGSDGKCVGKEEIDSYSGKKLGVGLGLSITLWERVTKDST